MTNPWRLLCDALWPEPMDTLPCSTKLRLYEHTHYVLSYKNPAVKNAIRNNKFHYHKASAEHLAHVCDAVFAKHHNTTIVPIPSSSARLKSRGFEHLLHILEHSQHANCVRTDLLRKSINTKPQSHVDKPTRLRQQQGTFVCNSEAVAALSGTIILFDDVVTTESTMAAARASLAPHVSSDATLVCLAIAH